MIIKQYKSDDGEYYCMIGDKERIYCMYETMYGMQKVTSFNIMWSDWKDKFIGNFNPSEYNVYIIIRRLFK